MSDQQAIIEQIEQAVASNQMSPSASKNILAWLSEPRYAEYVPQIVEHVRAAKWKELDDVFWTVIPFGTGGRRGSMYPFGSNAINDRTIGESAQGLADYVKSQLDPDDHLSCAIAYDTRHQSEHFARLCAEVMVAAGFNVFYLQGFRSTPALSFAVRFKQCSCGIMVTASHNPPSDNAVKVYWSNGAQLLAPHDQGVIDRVMSVESIGRVPFDEALADGSIELCQDEVDAAFIDAVVSLSTPGPRDLKIVYSPLHGVGTTAICPVLEKAGFSDVEVFALHADPDPDFPNVPGHVSNPENPAVFDSIVEHAREVGADLAVATDPDADRIGCAAPLTMAPDSPWHTLTGNQIGALLADHVLESRKQQGKLSADDFIVITLVTTQLTRRIADSYGVRTIGDLLVGFKWIASMIDQYGPDHFVYGTEESHGYLAGQHVRDKDGAVGAMLLCELAVKLKADGQTLHQKLESLYWQHGLHTERTVSVQMPGSEGMDRMIEVMQRFREQPLQELAGLRVERMRDYQNQVTVLGDGGNQPLEGPHGDLVILDLQAEGNYVAIRPSGTEPKIKLYMFTYEPPEQLASLESAQTKLDERLDQMEADMRAFAGV